MSRVECLQRAPVIHRYKQIMYTYANCVSSGCVVWLCDMQVDQCVPKTKLEVGLNLHDVHPGDTIMDNGKHVQRHGGRPELSLTENWCPNVTPCDGR